MGKQSRANREARERRIAPLPALGKKEARRRASFSNTLKEVNVRLDALPKLTMGDVVRQANERHDATLDRCFVVGGVVEPFRSSRER